MGRTPQIRSGIGGSGGKDREVFKGIRSLGSNWLEDEGSK